MIKILLAEDDSDDVYFFKAALEELSPDIQVRHAKNGNVLIQLLKELTPDFIFLDVYMPCKNGFDCIKEIRKNITYNEVPIIVLSSDTDSHTAHLACSFGADLYMSKEYSIKTLANKLKPVFSVLQANRARSSFSSITL